MHGSKDLVLLLESLEREAKCKGFQLIVEPSPDQDLYIIANPKNEKAAAVGLTEINNVKLIVSYSINMKRHKYYTDEGFETSQMIENPIKNEIFEFIPADQLINFLKK